MFKTNFALNVSCGEGLTDYLALLSHHISSETTHSEAAHLNCNFLAPLRVYVNLYRYLISTNQTDLTRFSIATLCNAEMDMRVVITSIFVEITRRSRIIPPRVKILARLLDLLTRQSALSSNKGCNGLCLTVAGR